MEPIFDVIEGFQLRQIGEQTLRATQTMAEAIRHLNKADRAAALDLGEDVFRQHHDAATRWNRQAQQQFRTVIERIDDRRSQDDWAGLVEQVRVEFPNRNGPQQLQDLAAEVKQVLLDADRLSGPDTAECVVIIDRSTSALIERGLSGIFEELRNAAESALRATRHPDMGRQPGSPISAVRAACIAAGWILAAVALAICSVLRFCWCCAWPRIARTLASALTA